MKFRGVSSPEIYILDYHDEDTEYPLVGRRGDFMMSLLGSFGLLDKIRIGNPVMQGRDTVETDIVSTNPKLIIGLGFPVVSNYLVTQKRITDLSGDFVDIKVKDQSYKLLILVSPSYVLQRINDESISIKFSQDLCKAAQYISGEYVDVLETKEILNAHSADEFIRICEEKFSEDEELGYDIETNARPPMSAGSRIIGLSVANRHTGVYASIDSLDFHMSEDDENKLWDYLINSIFEKKSKLTIHNTMYERPYTLYCKNYEINFDKAHDTLVMARLLRSPKEGAGLKYQAQKYLHYPDWETDLSKWIYGTSNLIDRIGLGPKKYQEVFTQIVNNPRDLFYLRDSDKGSPFKSLSDVDQEEILSIIDSCYTTLLDIYNENEIIELGELLVGKVEETVIKGGLKDSTIPYNWIPDRVLSRYGAVDAIATVDLKDYYFGIMDRDSTGKVDLHKGYENWLEHMYVAYIMERNGMYWNDEIASKDRAYLEAQAIRCLKSLMTSSCFTPFIESACGYKYNPIIFSDYLPQIPSLYDFNVVYDKTTDKYTLFQGGKRVNKGRISEIQIPSNMRTRYTEILSDLFYEDINNCNSLEELKEIYNPSSSTMSDIPRMILDTDTLQMGNRILNLYVLATSPEFEGIIDDLPIIDQKFLKTAKLCCDKDKLKEDYGKEWASYRKKFYEGFCQIYSIHKKSVTTPEIKEVLDKKKPLVIEAFDDGGIVQVYDSLVVTGMDPDDRSTWTPQFEWMVNFRLFKKSYKLVTSYIDGSVGRQSVAVVDKEELQSGSHRVCRKRKYNEGTAKSDEDYLLMAKWSPNSADTGRWRSAQHTVPWGSQVKKYYTSRFVGGTTCCPDYSQMEVRTLAAISKDKNMLDLFYSGKDFHTETAKKVYRKDEVTTAERRFSKTATFSLLYGAMEESFARNYCKGDLDYAKMVYGGFFEAYPDVKRWIDERHEEVKRDHRVSLELSNRFIQINPEGDGPGALSAMLRKAQNYPIQAQSADLTGCVIFDLQKYIEDNNMKSLVFMYVHDSIEVDIYPYELFKFIKYLKYLLNESPQRRMGLPSKADVALGKSLGHEIELEELEVSDDMTEGTMTLKGYKDEIDETVEVWRKAYKTVEVFDENYKDEFVSMGELFILRKAYSPVLGTTRHKGTCKVHINYYN